MPRFWVLVICTLLINRSSGQYNWKLEKDKTGIQVYTSEVKGSSFKAVKVECTLKGDYARLIGLLTNVSHFNDWIYHNKISKLLRQNTPLDFIYYSETSMPWPLSNRDVVIHVRISTDSLPRFLAISGTNETQLIPPVFGKVRVPHYKASWKVTMPTAETLRINYVLEIDPGGSIPAWIANSFADKGPFGSFSNLAEQLAK